MESFGSLYFFCFIGNYFEMSYYIKLTEEYTVVEIWMSLMYFAAGGEFKKEGFYLVCGKII